MVFRESFHAKVDKIFDLFHKGHPPLQVTDHQIFKNFAIIVSFVLDCSFDGKNVILTDFFDF